MTTSQEEDYSQYAPSQASAEDYSSYAPTQQNRPSYMDILGVPGRTPINISRDMTQGALTSMARGGQLAGSGLMQIPGAQSLANMIQQKTGISVPDPDMKQLFLSVGSAAPNQDPNQYQIAAQNVGGYLPYGIAGGASVLGQAIGGSGFEAAMSDPGQQNLYGYLPSGRVGSAIEGGVSGALQAKLLSSLSNSLFPKSEVETPQIQANYKQQATFGSPVGSEFGNYKINPPNFLQPQSPQVSSDAIADELRAQLSGGKSLTQTKQELASQINQSYQNKIAPLTDRYDKVFNAPGEISYQTGEPILAKDNLMFDSNYRSQARDAEYPDKNIQLLNDNFMADPSVQNAHLLQSELGGEIGYLTTQRSKGVLDSNGKNLLDTYSTARNTIKNDISGNLNNFQSGLGDEYQGITSDWNKEVVPYQSNKDLRDISRGNVQNPSISSLNRIFSDPEENINKVVSDLGQDGADKISYLAVGKPLNNMTPKSLSQISDNLDKKGMTQYLNPQHDQLISALRNQLSTEKNIGDINQQQGDFSKQLQIAANNAENQRIADSKSRLSAAQKAQTESQKIHSNYVKSLQDELDQRQKLESLRQENKAGLIRNTLGGAAIFGLGRVMGDVPAELLGSTISNKIGSMLKKRIS